MNGLLCRLDYLCIEVISKNIHRYSRTSHENWILRYCYGIGDRLILACLANSFLNRMDEKSYQFILNNFSVKTFKIFPRMFDKIEYFDFLSKKSLDKLKISSSKSIQLKNENNFQLTTNELKLNIEDKHSLINSYQFFSRLFVNKNIRITSLCQNKEELVNNEDIVLLIIKNSSKNLENLIIHKRIRTENFLEKLINILNEKKNLKILNFDFFNKFPTNNIFVNLFEKSFKNLTSFSLLHFKNIWNLQTINKCLRSLSCLKTLVIWFPHHVINDDLDEIRIFFSLLISNGSKSLKELLIILPKIDYHEKEVCQFLKSCLCLERINFYEKHTSKTIADDLFLSLIPSAKNIKYFLLQFFNFGIKEEIESLKSFFIRSSIQEICLEVVRFELELFQRFLEALENLYPHLTSLEIIDCSIPGTEFELLPNHLEKFCQLKSIRICNYQITPELANKIFNSLLSSSKTLQSIIIGRRGRLVVLENCKKLFQLLNLCEKLNTVKIYVSIKEGNIAELLSILKKFQYSIEEIDIDFCYSPGKISEIIDFISGCSRLKSIDGESLTDREFLKKVVNGLKNSKYSIENIGFFDMGNKDIVLEFPHFLCCL